MTQTTVSTPTHTPPAWLNRLMVVLLKTPGLQRLVGRSVALLTFQGRKTGRAYTIPVSYARSGNRVTLLTRTSRVWWRNLAGRTPVTLRLAGRTVRGWADARPGSIADVPFVTDYLAARPVDAKAYGVRRGPDGRPDPEDVGALVSQVVVATIDLEA